MSGTNGTTNGITNGSSSSSSSALREGIDYEYISEDPPSVSDDATSYTAGAVQPSEYTSDRPLEEAHTNGNSAGSIHVSSDELTNGRSSSTSHGSSSSTTNGSSSRH